MPSKQSDILRVYQIQFFAKLHNQNYLCFKKSLDFTWTKKIEYNDGSFKVLSAVGNLSFGK